MCPAMRFNYSLIKILNVFFCCVISSKICPRFKISTFSPPILLIGKQFVLFQVCFICKNDFAMRFFYSLIKILIVFFIYEINSKICPTFNISISSPPILLHGKQFFFKSASYEKTIFAMMFVCCPNRQMWWFRTIKPIILEKWVCRF